MNSVHTRRAAIVIMLLLVTAPLFAGACGSSKPPVVKPVATPRTIDDVTGIWRAPQGTLELRRNGTFVLIAAGTDAEAGKYTLSQDRFTAFDTKLCGGDQGTYRIQVAPKDRLVFSEPDDRCALRRGQLTSDPFVYG